ncbi:MAG: glutaredoxin 3 [Thiotrichaceae bacterium]|nr:glutaredoxin 3 [Thiotrichaceae bacterium]
MSKKVTIYTTLFCPYCVRARQLLKRKKIKFTELRVNDSRIRTEMERRAEGRTSVPQIFIDDHHVGGYDDLAQINSTGELDKLMTA